MTVSRTYLRICIHSAFFSVTFISNHFGLLSRVVPVLCGLWLTTACQSKRLAWKDYITYVNQPKNGLLQSTTVVGKVKLTAKYIPAAYTAYQEMLKANLPLTQAVYDSLTNFYQRSTTFQMTIESVDAKTDLRGLLCRDASNAAEMSEAMTRLDVEMPNQLHLSVGGKSYTPSLFVRENAPGLNRKVDFMLMFPIRLEQASGQADFVLDDIFFQTGKNTLSFEIQDLISLPSINL